MAVYFSKKIQDRMSNISGGKYFNEQKLQNFLTKFSIEKCSRYFNHIAYNNINVRQFINLLQQGRLGHTPYYNSSTYDKYLDEAGFFYHEFRGFNFDDHSYLWKLKNGEVIYTSIPHATREMILAHFKKIAENFSFPSTINLVFLDEKYRYYDIPVPMFMLYDENAVGGLI